MFTKIFLSVGPHNGSRGVIKDISSDEGEAVPSLLKFTLVDFGASHVGELFFLMTNPRKVSF